MQTVPTQTEKGAAEARLPWAHLRIPPFPQIAVRVLQLAGNTDTPIRQLSDLIAKDPAFSSEVLTIANSALYGSRVPIHSVLQAIAILGTDSLKGVCLTVGVRAYMGKALNHQSLRAIWRHSLACGLIAEELAPASSLNKDTAYTAGVLHDIGRTALAVIRPSEYATLLSTHTGSPSSILSDERQLFGFDHCEAGAQLITSWNLPEEFNAIVGEHHREAQRNRVWRLPDLIKISCRVADLAGFAVFPGCTMTTYSDLLASCTEQEHKLLPADFEDLAFAISSKINALELTA